MKRTFQPSNLKGKRRHALERVCLQKLVGQYFQTEEERAEKFYLLNTLGWPIQSSSSRKK